MTAHWLWFDGVEIANPNRVRSYINLATPDVDTPLDCPTCAEWAIDETYSGVALDPAPWFDEKVPASRDFFGLFVTRSGGFEDSMRAATVTQLLGDGGAVTGLRDTTREFRVSGALVGLTGKGIEVGSAWLSAALDAGRSGSMCDSGTLLEWKSDCSFFDPQSGFSQARSTVAVSGPRVMAEQVGALHYQWIEFFLVSPTPRIFSRPVPQAAYVEGAQEVRRAGVTISVPAAKAVCVPPPPPVTVLHPGSTLPPVPPEPPGTPQPPQANPTFTTRTAAFLPSGMSPSWSEAALSIRVHAPAAVNDIRVRVFEQVDPADTLATVDPCNLAGEFFIAHIPAGYSVEVDAAERKITGLTPTGDPAFVSHLVSSSILDHPITFPYVKAGRAAWVFVDSGGPVGLTIDASSVVR